MLCYYCLNDQVTIQCDASQSGLGATMMQNGPVAYASWALTPTETRYAQIEKELLAIMFACERFDAYVYGQHLLSALNSQLSFIVLEPVNNSTDYKHLQSYNLSADCQKYSTKNISRTKSDCRISRDFVT